MTAARTAGTSSGWLTLFAMTDDHHDQDRHHPIDITWAALHTVQLRAGSHSRLRWQMLDRKTDITSQQVSRGLAPLCVPLLRVGLLQLR
jgi:hypothetical protein